MTIEGNIGKRIIELPYCNSTNDYALQQIALGNSEAGDVIYTQNQQSGRGQKGNSWQSNPGENLTFSVVLEPRFLRPAYQFELTVVVSVAIVNYLRSKQIEATIKWPNDIYVGKDKIAGILIENKIKGTKINYSVIGIGLNVNQKEFDHLAATSMAQFIGRDFEVYEELFNLFQFLNESYVEFSRGKDLRSAYMKSIVGVGREIIFDDGEQFSSQVVDVDEYGALVLSKHGEEKKYGIKEIKFLSL